MKKYLSIVAPAYNEAAGIADTVTYWEMFIEQQKLDAEIVICNDGSTDNTRLILERLNDKYHNIVICDNIPNRGYGFALNKAIQCARGAFIMTMDSDGQFDVRGYTDLRNTLQKGGYDIVAGYRDKKRDSLGRVFADRALNLIMKLFFRLPFKDTNCAQKLCCRELIQKITIESKGYPAPTEILVKAHELGASIGETRVVHLERSSGKSKLRLLKVSYTFILFLIYLRLKIMLFRKKIITNL